MATDLYFLLTLCPALPELGEEPLLSLGEVCAHLAGADDPRLHRLARLFTTCQEIESAAAAWVMGENMPVSAACQEILTTELPECRNLLDQPPQSVSEAIWLTRMHELLSGWVESSARGLGSCLLADYTRFDRRLRQAVAAQRRLWWEEQQPGVTASMPEVAVPSAEETAFSVIPDVVARWYAAPDPMAGEVILDRARWAFISERAGNYSFSLEEMVGYLLQLRLVQRHRTFGRDQGTSLLQEVTAP